MGYNMFIRELVPVQGSRRKWDWGKGQLIYDEGPTESGWSQRGALEPGLPIRVTPVRRKPWGFMSRPWWVVRCGLARIDLGRWLSSPEAHPAELTTAARASLKGGLGGTGRGLRKKQVAAG